MQTVLNGFGYGLLAGMALEMTLAIWFPPKVGEGVSLILACGLCGAAIAW